jgi:hypothetical protein
MEPRPRLVGPLITLVALVPTALFILDRGETFVVLSLVSTVVIAASLYYMFSEADGAEHGRDRGGDGDGPFPG